MRCPNCGGYSFDWEDNCENCGYQLPHQKQPSWWGQEDFHGSGNIPSRQSKNANGFHQTADDAIGQIPELLICPHCRKESLYWAQQLHMYECLNHHCRRFVTQQELEDTRESKGEPVSDWTIPHKLRQAIEVFNDTQCSWCEKFYTWSPFLCPFRRLESSCLYFEKLDDLTKKAFIGDAKWWGRISDVIQQVSAKGIMAKCRKPECGAFNPNPQKPSCWKCQTSLCCPIHTELVLRYNLRINSWKCADASCHIFREYPSVPQYITSSGLDESVQVDEYPEVDESESAPKIIGEFPLPQTLAEPTRKGKVETLEKCPICGQGMLKWNSEISKYECLNWQCRRTVTREAFEAYREKRKRKQYSWLSRIRGIKWRSILFLLLSVFGIAVILYTSIHYVDLERPVYIGILATAVIITLWNLSTCLKLRKNKWYSASINQFILSLMLVVLVGCTAAAFTDVPPFSNAKQNIIEFVDNFGGTSNSEQITPTSKPTPVVTPRVVVVTPRPLTPSKTPNLPASDSSKVWVDSNTYLVGADGQPIILGNNPNARNPSWSKLVDFLRTDSTDKICYNEYSFVCADFAETLHNNAEKAGWRAAYVSIGLTGSEGGHALNAFQTTDIGLVYIDCTGLHCGEPRPMYMDSRVDLKVGGAYITECIFPEPDWFCTSPSMGIVTEIEVVQW